MTGGNDRTVSTERLLGTELARAAESLIAGMRPELLDPALAARLVTTRKLLASYWRLRRRRLPSPAVDQVPAPARGG